MLCAKFNWKWPIDEKFTEIHIQAENEQYVIWKGHSSYMYKELKSTSIGKNGWILWWIRELQ